MWQPPAIQSGYALTAETTEGARLWRTSSSNRGPKAIESYVVEDRTDHPLHKAKTQEAAIDWARKQGHEPLVARVRHLNDKKKPDHWRPA
jgi:hypothetical protein